MGVLGHSGIEVGAVGIGCNSFGSRIGADEVKAVVDAAFDAGITFFDTANSYGDGRSEELLGAALAGRRDEVVIATKFAMTTEGAAPDDVHRAVRESLQRLGTDHVDLYQLHKPDPRTPIADTLGALHELVEQGLVRAIGNSNFQAWQVVDADWTARNAGLTRFATAQNEYSLYNRAAEVELTPACQALGVGILPYYPLAYGLLTGKYDQFSEPPPGTRLAEDRQRRKFDGADWDRIDQLRTFAELRGISLLELAIGGLAAQPAVACVIAGVTRPEQVIANAAAARWSPTPEDMAELAEMGRPGMSYTTFA